jgi:hypothetical protein
MFGCATQEEAPEAPETPVVEEASPEEQPAEPESKALAEPDIASFRTADGRTFENESVVTLPTGGPSSGRLLPASSSGEVTLYVTRDGSVPSADNNWGGPIDPADPPPISRPLEGVASYRVVAALADEYSEPFTLTVIWEHEEDPEVEQPAFLVDGEPVSGSVSIPVSTGDDPAARLRIACGYAAATLYITRDGSQPSPDNYWKSQRCQGTYLWSPEPTAAEYRVIAVWQGAQSPVASLSVEWVE